MVYLFFNIIATGWIWLSEHFSYNSRPAPLFLVLALIWITILPAFQFDVGTDYFSYIKVMEGTKSSFVFSHNNEYAFFYLVELLKNANLPPHSIFTITSLIFSSLIINALRLLKKQGYNIALLFLIFAVTTGMIHNQMNGIRHYVAVYLFINAILYKNSSKFIISFIFVLFACLWHQTALFLIPVILIPNKLFLFLGKRPLTTYTVSCLAFSSLLVFSELIEIFILNLAPFYSHYVEDINDGIPLINFFTKLYYFLFFALFFLAFHKRYKHLSPYDIRLIGIWAISGGIFIGMLQTGLFFRVYHYFVFFSIFPIYWAIKSVKYKELTWPLLILILAAPYILKVTIFATGEYSYESIIGLFR